MANHLMGRLPQPQRNLWADPGAPGPRASGRPTMSGNLRWFRSPWILLAPAGPEQCLGRNVLMDRVTAVDPAEPPPGRRTHEANFRRAISRCQLAWRSNSDRQTGMSITSPFGDHWWRAIY